MKSRKLTKGRIRFLTSEEELQCINWYTSTGRDAQLDLFLFYTDTGLRKSEAFRLKFRDVDMKTGRITVWQSKTNQPRSVKMTTRLKRIMIKLYAVRKSDDELVFSNVAERRFYRDWIEMRDAIGLGDDQQFVIHMLRHTCCTRLLAAGVDIRTTMAWMGHASIEMTQRYAHFIPQNMDNAADKLDALTPETVTTTTNVMNLF
jgi:integrase